MSVKLTPFNLFGSYASSIYWVMFEVLYVNFVSILIISLFHFLQVAQSKDCATCFL